ncbi:hypothetical protein ACLKA6_010104 [Drosophila palustris]
MILGGGSSSSKNAHKMPESSQRGHYKTSPPAESLLVDLAATKPTDGSTSGSTAAAAAAATPARSGGPLNVQSA